jgi:hypothetical protein
MPGIAEHAPRRLTDELRIPAQSGQRFRRNPATHSD